MSLLSPIPHYCLLTKWLLSLSWYLYHCLVSSLSLPLAFFIHLFFFLFCSCPLLSGSLWILLFFSLSLLFSSPLACCLSCVNSRLALDDAIRHRQLNISRFSPRVAGENDFLQTVINKVIAAKEVNHKGQGKGHWGEHLSSPELLGVI